MSGDTYQVGSGATLQALLQRGRPQLLRSAVSSCLAESLCVPRLLQERSAALRGGNLSHVIPAMPVLFWPCSFFSIALRTDPSVCPSICPCVRPQAVFMDTPGIIASSRNKLDSAMMRNVKAALSQGDVLLAIVDSAAAAELEDPADGLEGLRSAAFAGGPQLCVVLNKVRCCKVWGRAGAGGVAGVTLGRCAFF